jgi:outer membrane receptor protein involved in Fe transport
VPLLTVLFFRFGLRLRLRLGVRAALLLFGVSPLIGQETGSVGGVVVSTWDGTPLPGVAVTVRGLTIATQSDANGKYEIRNVPTGDQVLRFSKGGYATATVTDVRVLAGQTTTVNGNLRPEFFDLEEYEVTAEEFNEQTEQILLERQQSAGMLEAIGSDMFKNLAVGDAAQALTKVTGATVADGKYAVIRGLADRYTFTTLNGLELPSADPDRKAFQLDLMPSKFIDRMDVYKTFTPDMSGGFAGGSIDIVTKSYPEKFLFEFRASTAYNTQSSLKDNFPRSDSGSLDWLAMDDGKRELPEEIAAVSPSGGQNYPAAAKSSFGSSQLAPVPSKSPLDSGMDLLFGNTHQAFGGRRLGYLAGINYKNEYRMYENGLVRSFDQGGRVVQIDKTDTQGTREAQWGALANLSLEMTEGQELKFNYLRVQAATDRARRAVGLDGEITDPDAGTYVDQSLLHWTERSLSYYQLAGEHLFPALNELKFDWGAALSTTTQDEPDYRIFQFYADPNVPDYRADIPSAQPNFPTRFWRELEENGKSFRGDFTIPVASYNDQENFIKTGAALNLSERDYMQRGVWALGTSQHPFIDIGDPNSWMTEENLQYINLRNFPANLTYKGEQSVTAGYLMADWAAFNWLRLVGGARYEATDISINTFNLTQNRALAPGSIKQNDWLPSLSAKFQIRTNLDLQAGWSRTVVRPTYREIAEVPLYDVTQNRQYFGNAALEMSSSENFDIRASWYPRPGELLSVSAFRKTIQKPIELSAIRTDNSEIRYENFGEAEVLGVEGEVRLKLDRIWGPLEPFVLGFNAAYITSEVALTEAQKRNRSFFGDTTETRPLYDQPDYILNANLTWDYQPTRTTVTLSGGVVGPSLVLVGLAKPDEFLQPAPELNLFVRQRFGKNWDVRFTAKNLLDPKYEIAQTWPEAGQVTLQSYTRGMTFGLSVGCEF